MAPGLRGDALVLLGDIVTAQSAELTASPPQPESAPRR
jgi:hypothetical protein